LLGRQGDWLDVVREMARWGGGAGAFAGSSCPRDIGGKAGPEAGCVRVEASAGWSGSPPSSDRRFHSVNPVTLLGGGRVL
jgi:hypothetical protein